jgi:hypothetical protein
MKCALMKARGLLILLLTFGISNSGGGRLGKVRLASCCIILLLHILSNNVNVFRQTSLQKRGGRQRERLAI